MTKAAAGPNPSNRLGLDYAAEAAGFRRLGFPIIDAHSHIHGREAARIYARGADLYGIGLTYSMTWIDEVPAVRETLGDRIRFIAMPRLQKIKEESHLPGMGLVRQVEAFHEHGAGMLKFWVGPRIRDFVEDLPPELAALDAPPRIEAIERAQALGMMFMVHVADPDTWFRTKYADAARYGTKRDQYAALERLCDRYEGPWIAAHMGGWPEDLDFLDGLLGRHENLYIDTSAAKWMIREISRQPRDRLLAFVERHQDRILFGSDIVTTDEHLTSEPGENPMHEKASNPEEAFDLYVSRYWALRTMWETDHRGESPIADPDLAMVDPDRHDETSAPELIGKTLPDHLLRKLYHDNAAALLGRFYGD